MNIWVLFYNIPETPDKAELGPFSSIVCDSFEVTAVYEDETEEVLASFSDAAEMWHVHGDYPDYYAYFEVYSK